MAPGTEFARYFCAGIGPLQLGVVLVFYDQMLLNKRFGVIQYQGPYFPTR